MRGDRAGVGVGWMTVVVLCILATACGPTDAAAIGGDPATSVVATMNGMTETTGTTEAPGTTSATAVASDSCPDENFLVAEVNSYEQSNGIANPELEVTCTGEFLVVTGNGIMNHEFVQVTPNDVAAQRNVYEIPLVPVVAETPGALGLGTVGVAANGVAIFGAFEAPFDGYQDPYLDGLLDFCNGHTAPGGVYHYHAAFGCIFDDPSAVGLVYGYLFDGYEIVSPFICADDACSETVEATAAYVRVDEGSLGAFDAWTYEEGAGDLDVCNGMVGDDGVYRYYLTSEFPYVPFCYHGVTDASVGAFSGDAPAGGRP